MTDAPTGEDVRRVLYQQLDDPRPLEPGDPRYVRLLGRDDLGTDDPIELIVDAIEMSARDESVQLLGGPRGSGKSTELRRLAQDLAHRGYFVALVDFLDFLDPALPVDIGDFMTFVVGALDEEVTKRGLGPSEGKGFMARTWALMNREVEVTDLTVGAKGGPVEGSLKLGLKSDPRFRAEVQETLKTHLGAFSTEVDDFIRGLVKRIRARQGDDFRGVVLLVDSTEQVRGSYATADQVQQSVETLFSVHAERLGLPEVHVVYTIHPYLRFRIPNLRALYTGVRMFHSVKVRSKANERIPASFEALAEIVTRRGEWEQVLGDRATLDRLIAITGGHLRLLLRLLADITLRARVMPVPGSTVDRAISELRNGVIVTVEDRQWLRQVLETKAVDPANMAQVPRIASFLDSYVVLSYANGDEWYDVLPLIEDDLARADIAEEPVADE